MNFSLTPEHLQQFSYLGRKSQHEITSFSDTSLFKAFSYHGPHHTMGSIAWRGFRTNPPHAPAAAGHGLCYDERHQVVAAKPTPTLSDAGWR